MQPKRALIMHPHDNVATANPKTYATAEDIM